MSLFHELDRSGQMIRHAQPDHHDADSSSCKRGDGELVFDVAKFAFAASACTEDTQVEEFTEEEVFVFLPDGVGRVEIGEAVRELFEGAGETVVVGVIGGLLDDVAATDLFEFVSTWNS